MIASIRELDKSDLNQDLKRLYGTFGGEAVLSLTQTELNEWYESKDRAKVFVYLATHEKYGDATSFETDIAGVASLIIETKLIHGLCKVGHIEDVVVDETYRGKGIGKSLINRLVREAKSQGCYKVVLNCVPDLRKFYEQCGFTDDGICFSVRF